LRIRFGQLGTRHGHAAGKWQALLTNPDVDPVGIFEPETTFRERGEFPKARWCTSAAELLEDPSVSAVAIEGRNHQSLSMASQAVHAGKHLWLDKPPGDDWPAFVRLMEEADHRRLYVQVGYMYRYSTDFQRVAEQVRSGRLGDVFAIRAHMSTSIEAAERREQSRHLGGIFYDLAGHMLDQITWLLGRPSRISTTLRNDATPEVPAYVDNSVGVLEFPSAVAVIDIAAMETPPTARRFEVYGTDGTAIVEPFDPPATPRQELYNRELAAFVGVLRGERAADRSPEHELLVQETLLRATGRLAE
jgi:predicted dehydrogenase